MPSLKIWETEGIKSFVDVYAVLPHLLSWDRIIILTTDSFEDIYKLESLLKLICSSSLIHQIKSFRQLSGYIYPLGKSVVCSCIYELITLLEIPLLSIVMGLWEEKNLQTDEETWASVVKRVHSSGVWTWHGLLQFKVVHTSSFLQIITRQKNGLYAVQSFNGISPQHWHNAWTPEKTPRCHSGRHTSRKGTTLVSVLYLLAGSAF